MISIEFTLLKPEENQQMTIANIKHQEGTFLGAGNVELYYQSWHPNPPSSAVIAMVHGLGVYSNIFDNMVGFLCDRQYTVYSFDLRGHGRSPGQRGYINSWSEFREDLRAFLQLIANKELNLPVFLLGQSLGGAMVLDYALHYPNHLQGLILLSPALKTGVSPLRITIGRIMSLFYPRFALDTGIDTTTSSRDPEVVKALAEDGMIHTKGTAGLATAFLKTTAGIKANLHKLQVPILILQGGADRITLPESSRSLYEKITFTDKEIREYPESYHQLQNDLDYQDVFMDINNWLEKHL